MSTHMRLEEHRNSDLQRQRNNEPNEVAYKFDVKFIILTRSCLFVTKTGPPKYIMKLAILALTLSIIIGDSSAHDSYSGSCPDFSPMPGFDWDKFREGRWYAMEKFGTTQSKCFTYDFGVDEDGFKFVEQNSVLTGLKRFSIDNKYRYRGRLASPSRAEPDILGSASFNVMDTDYDKYALLCTCQAKSLLLLSFHRRSCTILQREPIPDAEISKKLHDLLNAKVEVSGESELPDHDFDLVDHSNCDYSDREKGLQIDVDKILGLAGDEIEGGIAKAVDELGGGFFGEGDREELNGDLNKNLPLKEEEPRV
ncbi:hypothetical protein TCAL_11401 [Tigriopus californicus]|uniref:Lipocalin/cytosolic fatty-acid binding domain-containing protein n=1 Tax=Tigriopus californicus TaxID=6832 RepID=A0A553PFQ6_TIGCA|nr:hypothetical protein TCAL_11401 [Tigriopus californicus]